MEITNNQMLPSPLPELAALSCHTPSSAFRCTELIAPPMIRKLLVEMWDQLKVDAEDFLPSQLGTAWHTYLSGYKLDGVLQEIRLKMEIDGVPVTGGIDWFHIQSGWLNDWKTSSTGVWIFGRDEWVSQLNVYAELLRRAGYTVERLTDTILFQGWTSTEASRKSVEDYPPKRLMIIEQSLWSSEQTLAFIRSRLDAHALCVPCTEEERWGRGGTFAITKPGAARAIRVLPTLSEARDYCHMAKINMSWIVERPKTYIRCEKFCPVRSVCPILK